MNVFVVAKLYSKKLKKFDAAIASTFVFLIASRIWLGLPAPPQQIKGTSIFFNTYFISSMS